MTQIHAPNAWEQHDAQLDYYGKRLATCSSDRTVRVFDVVDGEMQRGAGQILKGCVSQYNTSSGHSLAPWVQSYSTCLASRLGAPEIRPYPCFVLLRRQSHHLEGTTRTAGGDWLGKDQRAHLSCSVWCVLNSPHYVLTAHSTPPTS